MRPGRLDPFYFTSVWAPLPRHLLGEQRPEEVAYGDYSRTPMGYGPYTVRRWVRGEYIMLQRNPYYYRYAEGMPRVQFLVFKFVPDPDQRLQMLIDEKIDLAVGLELDQARALLEAAESGELRAYFTPGQVWELLAFNLDSPILGELAVRRAIAFGTDRQRMVDELLYGKVKVMNSWLPPDHPYYPGDDALSLYPYDLDKAGQVLATAGWTQEPMACAGRTASAWN